jgi:hypothetical protein
MSNAWNILVMITGRAGFSEQQVVQTRILAVHRIKAASSLVYTEKNKKKNRKVI